MANVQLNARADIARKPDTDPALGMISVEAPVAVGYLVSFLMTALATVVAVGVNSRVNIPNLSLVFVVPVITAAVVFGLGPSLCSAVLGALAYNFFLTEPRYSLVVDDPSNVWAIALLFVVGLIVSGVAFTSRRKAIEAELLRRQATVLQDYGHDALGAGDTKAILSGASRALAALFNVPVVVMLVADGDVKAIERLGGAVLHDSDLEAAKSSLTTETITPAGVYPNLVSRFDFWPVTTAVGRSAVIGLAFDPDERPPRPSVSVDIVASILSLALERQCLRKGQNA